MSGGYDFWDMANEQGHDAVRKALEKRIYPGSGRPPLRHPDWPPAATRGPRK